MNFGAIFRLLSENFKKAKIDFAVIGGFALSVSGYPRSTEDTDLLIAQNDLPRVKNIF